MFAGRAIRLLGLASLLALGSVAPASAELMLGLQFSEPGYNTYSVTGALDPLIVVQNFGTFSTNIEVANVSTDPLSIDLGSLNLSAFAPGNLTITASVTGLTAPLGQISFLSQLSGNESGSVNSVSLQTFLSTSDTMFGTDTLLTSQTATNGPFAMAQYSPTTTTTASYGITEVLSIKTSGMANISVDASTTAAPEIDARSGGAAIALLVGLIVLFAERRRRPLSAV
jgi:hypothetical protein